jgi:hypothetical protein
MIELRKSHTAIHHDGGLQFGKAKEN